MRPVNLSRPFSGGLGQQSQQMTGVNVGYNEASQWLADAEKVIAANPACNLPIVDTFRSFVNNTAGTSVDRVNARMALTPQDMQSLSDFKQCQISRPAASQAADALAATAAAEKTDKIVGISVAAATLLGLGYLISKAS